MKDLINSGTVSTIRACFIIRDDKNTIAERHYEKHYLEFVTFIAKSSQKN